MRGEESEVWASRKAPVWALAGVGPPMEEAASACRTSRSNCCISYTCLTREVDKEAQHADDRRYKQQKRVDLNFVAQGQVNFVAQGQKGRPGDQRMG